MNTGPSDGGSTITVTGNGFLTTPFCQFDGSNTLGTSVSSTTVQCITPSHTAASVFVSVSNNGVDYPTSSVLYTFYGI